MRRLVRRQRSAQSTVEYVLMLSVITIAIAWIAGDAFWPTFQDGLQAMQHSMEDMTREGVVDGR